MPDVSSIAPAEVRLWVALDVHKLSIVARRCRRRAACRSQGIENTRARDPPADRPARRPRGAGGLLRGRPVRL